jgi:hypothetical protein
MFEATIIGLPRSRTFWFSQLLTHGDSKCFHCYPMYDNEIPEGKRLFNSTCHPYEGIEGKLVIIERPVPEAYESFMKFAHNMPKNFDKRYYRAIVRQFHFLQSLKGLHVKYDQINDRIDEILAYIGVDLPKEWIEQCLNTNMQTGDNDMNFSGTLRPPIIRPQSLMGTFQAQSPS